MSSIGSHHRYGRCVNAGFSPVVPPCTGRMVSPSRDVYKACLCISVNCAYEATISIAVAKVGLRLMVGGPETVDGA